MLSLYFFYSRLSQRILAALVGARASYSSPMVFLNGRSSLKNELNLFHAFGKNKYKKSSVIDGRFFHHTYYFFALLLANVNGSELPPEYIVKLRLELMCSLIACRASSGMCIFIAPTTARWL